MASRRLSSLGPRALAASTVLLLAACGQSPDRGRLLVLGFDGLDPDVVDLLVGERKLPHFAQLAGAGASGRLASSSGSCAETWTTIATGRLPADHGIRVGGGGAAAECSTRQRRVKAVWNIFSEARRRVAVVGWWATWPAEPVRGAIVSDHACYHFRDRGVAHGGIGTSGTMHPPELQAEVGRMFRRPGDLTLAEAASFVHVSAHEFGQPFDGADVLSQFKWALASAASHRQVGLHLWEREQPDLLLVYVEALHVTSALFGHLFRAGELDTELADQRARFGSAVEEMYRYADRTLGDFMQAMDRRTTLLVLSDHGAVLGRASNGHGPTGHAGAIYLYGRAVRAGARLEGPAPVDIVPSLLALTTLPRADDMPGRVLTDGLALGAAPAPVSTYETAR